MVNYHDIAKLAKVSSTTVSHVINETRFVVPETRRRVLEAMKKLKYQPNLFARSLSTGINIGKEGTGLGKIIERFAVYMIVFFLIIILNILYLGGWNGIYFIRGEIIIAVKFYFIFALLLLLDKAVTRIDNYKLLIRINWKFLVPVSLFNFIITLGFFIDRGEIIGEYKKSEISMEELTEKLLMVSAWNSGKEITNECEEQ